MTDQPHRLACALTTCAVSNEVTRGRLAMVASDGFAEFVRDQLAPLGRVTMQRMFGKTPESLRRRGDARDGEGQHALLSGASATRCSDGALASVATLSSPVIAFVIAMAVGSLLD